MARSVELLLFVGCGLRLAADVCEASPLVRMGVALGFWAASGEAASDRLGGVLDRSELVFLNAVEFTNLPSGWRDYLRGDWLVRDNARRLVVTNGASPALVYSRDGVFRSAARRIEEVSDTIGCGDAFMGAFVASHLIDLDIEKACTAAHAAAAAVARSPRERILGAQ